MDIYQRLRADHDRQRSLVAAILRDVDNLEKRRRLLYELCAELDAHAAAEEQTYCAALLTHARDHGKIQQSVGEHDELAERAVELACSDFEDPSWMLRFDALKEKLVQHLDREESDGFALARRHLDDDGARSLGDRFVRLKEVELGGGMALATQLMPALDELPDSRLLEIGGLRSC